MVQGDAYFIPVGIKFRGTVVTSENCDAVKIKIGSLTKVSGQGGTVVYDSTTQKWNFPLSQSESLALSLNSMMEVQIKINTDVFSSEPQKLNITTGIIKEVWNG